MCLYKEIVAVDAEILRNENWIIYDSNSVVRDDIILLQEGDRVPADGVVVQAILDEEEGGGNSVSMLDTSAVIPPQKRQEKRNTVVREGSKVWAGSLVCSGRFVVRVERVGKYTLLSKLIKSGKWQKHGVGHEDIDDIFSRLQSKQNEPFLKCTQI
jgi:Ca2+-transporting ATPase